MQDCCVNEHGWQTACGQTEGCTLQSTAQLAEKGAFSEALPSASAAHVLAAARDATRRFRGSWLANTLSPPLSTHVLDYAGKVLRVRTPIHDGFWVRALFTVALGSWASLSGIPFFVDPHVDAACGATQTTCATGTGGYLVAPSSEENDAILPFPVPGASRDVVIGDFNGVVCYPVDSDLTALLADIHAY